MDLVLSRSEAEIDKWVAAGATLPAPVKPGRKPAGKAKAKAKARGKAKAKATAKSKARASSSKPGPKAKAKAKASASRATAKAKAKAKGRKAKAPGEFASKESEKSSAYHKARRLAKKQGLADDEAKDIARKSFLVQN